MAQLLPFTIQLMHLHTIPGASQRHCRPAPIFTPLVASGHWLLAVLLSHTPQVRLVLLTLLVLSPLGHTSPLASPPLGLTPAINLIIMCCPATTSILKLLLPQLLILHRSAILSTPHPLEGASAYSTSQLIISPGAAPLTLIVVVACIDAAMPGLLSVLPKLLPVQCVLLLVHLHFGGCSSLLKVLFYL